MVKSPELPFDADDPLIETDVDFFLRRDGAVVLHRFLSRRLVSLDRKWMTADFNQFGGRKELHPGWIPDDRIDQGALVDDEGTEPFALRLDRTGESDRAGSNDEDINRVGHVLPIVPLRTAVVGIAGRGRSLRRCRFEAKSFRERLSERMVRDPADRHDLTKRSERFHRDTRRDQPLDDPLTNLGCDITGRIPGESREMRQRGGSLRRDLPEIRAAPRSTAPPREGTRRR